MAYVLFIVSALLTIGSLTTAQDSKEAKLTHASNDIAFDLLRQYKTEKNVFISPASISTALAMLYLGSSGHTAETMSQVLKYQQYGLTEQDVHEGFQSMLNRLKQNTDGYQLSIANEALVQHEFTISPAYAQALQEDYSTIIDSVDFSHGEEIKQRINNFVENATRGKITDFLNQPPAHNTVLFILNAVYFIGNWQHQFNPEDTFEGSFYNNGDTEVRVPLMNKVREYRYGSSPELRASVVVLPYKGEANASMIIVVPNARNGIAELQEIITKDNLFQAVENARSERIMLMIPRFSNAYSVNLKEALSNLGLSELFTNDADLSRIAEGARLQVSAIPHKAVIDVNERGTEAAGITGIEIVPISMPSTVKADHPFLYFIRENQNGMILFAGKVDEL